MSKGSPITLVRLPTDLIAEIELTIARRNVHTRREPWDTSKFIRDAIREKIRKMERSRAPRAR